MREQSAWVGVAGSAVLGAVLLGSALANSSEQAVSTRGMMKDSSALANSSEQAVSTRGMMKDSMAGPTGGSQATFISMENEAVPLTLARTARTTAAKVPSADQDAATLHGRLLQVEDAQRLVILAVPATSLRPISPGSAPAGQRTDEVFVLLQPTTRVTLPHGQAFADLQTGQAVRVTGTLNWQTHILQPTSLSIGVPMATPACSTLAVTGDQSC